MLQWFRADLHIHTVLSPCGDLLMGPINIVKQAQKKGLDIIAITDHNSAENVEAVIKAAEGTGITIIAGMEVATSEEAHMICLFSWLDDVFSLQKIVYENLPAEENVDEIFGEQLIVNEKHEVVEHNSRLLISATKIKAKDLIQLVIERNGIIYPAHVDNKAYSLIRQLGFIPADLNLPALEISPNANKDEVLTQFPHVAEYKFIRSSDAHRPEDVGNDYTMFYLKNPCLSEIKKALLQKDGRTLRIDGWYLS